MALLTGSQLGPYQIVAPLGVGGMGEVYRAHDSRLRREVAIKVVPEATAHDAVRMARFAREAQFLAALNHPNIGSIYGFEESSTMLALVMELVEGPTLADRIAQGPIPVEDALPILKQIAEARGLAARQIPINQRLWRLRRREFATARASNSVSRSNSSSRCMQSIRGPS